MIILSEAIHKANKPHKSKWCNEIIKKGVFMPKYDTLQSIVDQLEQYGYVDKFGFRRIEMDAAFIALKERAKAESLSKD